MQRQPPVSRLCEERPPAAATPWGAMASVCSRGAQLWVGGRESPPERSLSFSFLLSILALKFL